MTAGLYGYDSRLKRIVILGEHLGLASALALAEIEVVAELGHHVKMDGAGDSVLVHTAQHSLDHNTMLIVESQVYLTVTAELDGAAHRLIGEIYSLIIKIRELIVRIVARGEQSRQNGGNSRYLDCFHDSSIVLLVTFLSITNRRFAEDC